MDTPGIRPEDFETNYKEARVCVSVQTKELLNGFHHSINTFDKVFYPGGAYVHFEKLQRRLVVPRLQIAMRGKGEMAMFLYFPLGRIG